MPKIRTHRHYRPRHQLTSMVIYVEFCDVLMNVEVFDLYPCHLRTQMKRGERQAIILVLLHNLPIATC